MRTPRCLLALTLVVALLPLSPSAGHAAEPTAYSAFRVVRSVPGDPSVPQVALPPGYTFVTGTQYHVASRAEYYTFLQGPRSQGVPVTVRWPGIDVEAVIWADSRLQFTRDPADPYTITFTLPVTGTSVNANQPTIQVWSYLPTAPGIFYRVEHNDPDRKAGPWNTVPWPAGQVRSVVNYLAAAEAVLRDSGLAATAASKGHIFALMGFETNNTLHPDNPPHWHLAYYAGPNTSARAYLPHIWLDGEGRNYYNGMDVSGQGRSRFYVGDPAAMYDFAGNLVVTITIREDGGLDIDPPNGPRYSIVPGKDGTFVKDLVVERGGVPWLAVKTHDQVLDGTLVIMAKHLQGAEAEQTTVYHYDRLTGMLR